METKANEGRPDPPGRPCQKRSPKAVIDQSIRENTRWENLALAVAWGYAIAGGLVVAAGLARGDWAMVASAAAPGFPFAAALWYAQRARRANIALRLMEIAAGDPTASPAATDAILRVFEELFVNGARDGPPQT